MTINVTAVNDDPTGAPVITGAARVGQTLSASRTGIGDVDGLPANESDYAYQWVRVDGGTSTDITGATSRTYEVAAADEDKKLKVEVNYTDDGGTPEEVASAETATVGTNTAPVAANSAVETAEDTSYTFQATGRDVLTGSSFTLTEGSEESGFASLWSRGRFVVRRARGRSQDWQPLGRAFSALSQYGADFACDVRHVPVGRVGQSVGLAEKPAEKPLLDNGL